jgi:hypothetical protein
MLKMKASVLLFTILVCGHCNAQLGWKESSVWDIYNIADRLILSVPVDSLSNCSHRNLDLDTMQNFMALATKFGDSVRPMWMGGFLLSYEYKGKMFEMQISSYGGFFFDQRLNHYYVVPKHVAERLLAYLNRKLTFQ